jgi:hypothetical protein
VNGLRAGFHWRQLAANPIYLREKGVWGNPHPYYDRLALLVPLILLPGLLLGLCGAPAGLLPLTAISELFIGVYCLLCLPAVLLQALTWLGVFMAPALTATSLGREIDQGNWDILRLTPQPVRLIVAAKLLGALARLRLWPLLWLLSLLQALALGAGFLLAGSLYNWFWVIPVTLSSLLRPSLEIFWAGLLGMTVSLWVRSAIMALATTYGLIILFRTAVWLMSWLLLSLTVELLGDYGALWPFLLPTAAYLLASALMIAVLAYGLRPWL